MHRLRCFGRVVLDTSDGEELRLRSAKHTALLLYLASNPDHLHPREKLASFFWDTEPRLARHSLSQALYDIRSHIPDLRLETTATTVGLRSSGLAFDARIFEEAIRDQKLAEAVRLYDGDFAPDFEHAGNGDFDRWVEDERQRLRRLAEIVLYRYVRECDDRGRWGEMCVSAVRLVEMNPLDESAHRALMRGLWLQGDRVAALRHFDEVERTLAPELLEGLSQETVDLVARIRESRPGGISSVLHEEVRPPMVGREDEFEALKVALRDAGTGRSILVVVTGEAGVGKTRLLQEFHEFVSIENVRLLESRCYQAETGVPYGPILDGLENVAREFGRSGPDAPTYYQLGHLFPDVFPRPDDANDSFSAPDAGRRRLYEETADLVRRACEASPIVWTVDDAHWMDASSAALLHYVLRRLSGYPLLLVATLRSHEKLSEAARALLETSDLSYEVRSFRVPPLESTSLASLIAHLQQDAPHTAFVQQIYRLTGGNPLYVIELLRSTDGVPNTDMFGTLAVVPVTDRLNTLLKARLFDVTTQERDLLEAVAVLERDATPQLLRRITNLPPETLEAVSRSLYERHLLLDEDGIIRIGNDITRSFIYEQMGLMAKSALHLRAANILEQTSQALDYSTLAYHYHRANERERAVAAALEAARQHAKQHAHEETIDLALLALEHAESHSDRIEALQHLSAAELSLGRLAKAQHHLSLLADEHSESPQNSIATRLRHVEALIGIGAWEQAAEMLEDTKEEMSQAGNDAFLSETITASHLTIKIAIKRNRREASSQGYEELRKLYASKRKALFDAEDATLARLSFAAHTLFFGSASESWSMLDPMLLQASSLPYGLRMRVYMLCGIAAARNGYLDRSRYINAKAVQEAAERRDVAAWLAGLNNQLVLAVEMGEWERCDQIAQQITSVGETVDGTLHALQTAQLNLADSYFYRGQTHQAIALYEEILPTVRRLGADSDELVILAALALCYLQCADRVKAAEVIAKQRQLRSTGWCQLRGIQERVKVHWLDTFNAWSESKEKAVEVLTEVLSKENDEGDKVASLKLRWLLQLFQSENGRKLNEEAGRAKKDLTDHGLGWFAYFTQRWLRAAQRAANAEVAGTQVNRR